jgi:hypothetical protein
VEALYAFAALQPSDGDAEADSDGIRTLVLCPTDERAGRVARSLRAAGGPEGPKVFFAGGGWVEAGGIPAGTRILVSRPSRVLPAIRSGHLGIGSLELLILDGVASLSHLDEWSSVEPVLDAMGSEVRRIAATSRSDEAFRQLLERRLPRGRRWPEELLPIAGTVPEADEPGQGPLLRVAVGPSSQRLALLEACVTAAGSPEESILVTCADRSEAEQAAAALGVLGREAIVEGNRIRLEGSRPDSTPVARILFGAPFDLGEFREALDQADHRFVVVEQGRLAHVENLAHRAGMRIAVAGGAPPGDLLDAVVIYRRRLEDAI